MPLSRSFAYSLRSTAPVGVSRPGTYGTLVDIATGGLGSSTYAASSAATIRWARSGAAAVGAPNSFSSGSPMWVHNPAQFTTDNPTGFVVLPAQTLTLRLFVSSSASNALALTSGTYLPRASLWAAEPSNSGSASLIAVGAGTAGATRGLSPVSPHLLNLVVSSDYVFPIGRTMWLVIGGDVTSPQPALGSNTETYTFDAAGSTMEVPLPVRAYYPRSVTQGITLPTHTASRQIDVVRRPLEVVTEDDMASRVITYGRRVSRTDVQGREAIRQVNFPRQAEQGIEQVVEQAQRQVTFRRPVEAEVPEAADAARRISMVRRISPDVVDLDALALRSITYGRRVGYSHQPAEDPVIDPTREIRVRVLNGDGADHGAGAYVVLFRSDNNLAVQSATTDESSEVAFPRNSFDSFRYFVAAWDQDGVPLGQAVSERTLEPELVG